MKSEPERTIHSSLKECRSHIEKMEQAQQHVSALLPLTVLSLSALDADQLAYIDQFVYRFMKLQDSLARRLLPSLYGYLEPQGDEVPFLDVLSRLEQLGAISSEAEWRFFRNLRNNLAHDYPENLEQTADALNVLFSEWRRLASIYRQATEYYQMHRHEE